MKVTNSGILSGCCAVWTTIKIKLNAEHCEINTNAPIFQYCVLQQSNCFEHKLLTTTVEQTFNISFDFQMPVVSSVIQEGNKLCFRTSEHVSIVVGVFVIKVCMKPYPDRFRRYCFLLMLNTAKQEGNDKCFMVVNSEMHRERNEHV
jgi:hypothetical protein